MYCFTLKFIVILPTNQINSVIIIGPMVEWWDVCLRSWGIPVQSLRAPKFISIRGQSRVLKIYLRKAEEEEENYES